jgi:hypothetical protein
VMERTKRSFEQIGKAATQAGARPSRPAATSPDALLVRRSGGRTGMRWPSCSNVAGAAPNAFLNRSAPSSLRVLDRVLISQMGGKDRVRARLVKAAQI